MNSANQLSAYPAAVPLSLDISQFAISADFPLSSHSQETTPS